MPDSTFSPGWYYLGLRTGTKGGTFSPETLVPARSPGLEVLLDREYNPLYSSEKMRRENRVSRELKTLG
jgi:hypothetical protein